MSLTIVEVMVLDEAGGRLLEEVRKSSSRYSSTRSEVPQFPGTGVHCSIISRT